VLLQAGGVTVAYETVGAEPPPVSDWVNDRDRLDDQWDPNAIAIGNEMRERYPIADAVGVHSWGLPHADNASADHHRRHSQNSHSF